MVSVCIIFTGSSELGTLDHLNIYLSISALKTNEEESTSTFT